MVTNNVKFHGKGASADGRNYRPTNSNLYGRLYIPQTPKITEPIPVE